MSNYLSIPEVADELGLSAATIRQYITDRQLKAFKLGTGGKTSPIRVKRTDLETFVEAGAL
ncbi:helix-turn-helix domain-containing protein [Rhodococcus sp. H29-C3]|uniref:helix-turn-helix domain-containing protein n=1 Tax=Rhodococcus sp. H29-C3 TaxID=3046307 RepID=UPI0024BA9647|nr:helix-turn-helix domain-containing protein [Rhodococcus sp. H29-C3]MDJ0360685.1 helix-turn-helix domain-containing protein [Rhodococcus sp. H29-C3]